MIVDVSGWEREDAETMGARDKVWVADRGQRWLFKAPRARGLYEPGADLWAELIASGVAALLGTPAAEVLPATLDGIHGVISKSVGGPLVHGNELLAARNPAYDSAGKGHVAGYDLDSIQGALADYDGSEPGLTAYESFIGYLIFDAVVGNTDRHHENWALVQATSRLAPSYDHGVSLGYNATEADRVDVARFARQGRSRHFPGRLTLVDLAQRAVASLAGSVGDQLLGRVAALDLRRVEEVVSGVPADWMSEAARTFVGLTSSR